MSTRVSIRELRNHTKQVVDQASREGVILTSHGKDVARIIPIVSDWDRIVDAALEELPAATDTGWLDELAADDGASMDDIT